MSVDGTQVRQARFAGRYGTSRKGWEMAHAKGFAWQHAQVGETPGPAPRFWWRRLFRGEERELRRLRQWLTGLLPDCPARDDLLSVAVELGTNAIQHTASGQGGWFTVEVARQGHVARVAVADGGAPSGPCVNEDPMSDCGRGLVIVRALSLRTGVCGDASGRTVWAEILCATGPSPVPAANGCQVGQAALDGARAPAG